MQFDLTAKVFPFITKVYKKQQKAPVAAKRLPSVGRSSKVCSKTLGTFGAVIAAARAQKRWVSNRNRVRCGRDVKMCVCCQLPHTDAHRYTLCAGCCVCLLVKQTLSWCCSCYLRHFLGVVFFSSLCKSDSFACFDWNGCERIIVKRDN